MSKKDPDKNKWEDLAETANKNNEMEADNDQEKALEYPTREELEKQLTDTEQKYQDTLSALRYSQAALENERKRAHKELQDERQFGQKDIIKQLLNVNDSLEKSLEIINQHPSETKTIREGVELTLKMLSNLLEKHAVTVINPVKSVFDPHWHQAMSMVENAEVKSNHIITVLQKGYKSADYYPINN